MEIAIVTGAMPFGPDTLAHKSLGGSETAALQLGKALAGRGHAVRHFCNLPPAGQPDAWKGGDKHEDGVRYLDLQVYSTLTQTFSFDLVIITRDPSIAAMPSIARKKVLWMHDVATKRGMARAFEQMRWAIDEVWTVSEWHRQQVHEATEYPLDHIVALRNGIVKVDELVDAPRSKKQLLFASRPERGLHELLMPGGVMENLPEFNLVVCMYDHFPEHMKQFYEWVFRRMKELPNVTYLGAKPQQGLRQIIKDSAAYIYPTRFEETSCILARECIEQRTPFLTTRTGALPETLGDCGCYFEDWMRVNNRVMPAAGSAQWCEEFAKFFREMLPRSEQFQQRMAQRTDLYWHGVAEMVEQHAFPREVTPFSRAYSLICDGDVIAAKAYIRGAICTDNEKHLMHLKREIDTYYPFLLSEDDPRYKSMAEYYEWVYTHKADSAQSELHFNTELWSQRHEQIAAGLARLAPGSKVLEYGCGPCHLLAPLAVKFPHLQFYGVEISQAAVDVAAGKLPNMTVMQGDIGSLPLLVDSMDAAIISEVLEHVLEPWDIATRVEAVVKQGGQMFVTCPFGPWELATTRQPGRFHERAHIWHLDSRAIFKMFENKPNRQTSAVPTTLALDGRAVGHTIAVYNVDHVAIAPIDPLKKALEHTPRQSVVACIIAMNNEDTIVHMLNSIQNDVQWVNIALGPSTDNTYDLVKGWMEDHPWIGHTIYDVPKIEPYKFGFDDARNISTTGRGSFDWFFWLDTDEYMSGSFSKYLRNNCLDGITIPQHHFTCQPRGGETQVDRPARLLRSEKSYMARGHIHEHFELGGERGIGLVFCPPDVDLGHTGYVNEDVRRNRFMRNFPFLEWDDKEANPRKLHKFLWFRDIIHRVRILRQQGDLDRASKLAREGLDHYNKHWDALVTFGQGFHMALAYVAELREFLQEGVPMEVRLVIDDKQTAFSTRFVDQAELDRVLGTILKDEFKDRASRYYG